MNIHAGIDMDMYMYPVSICTYTEVDAYITLRYTT